MYLIISGKIIQVWAGIIKYIQNENFLRSEMAILKRIKV